MKNNIPTDIHLILVSDQAVPNITPILDERFKPAEVIMLVSKDKQKQAGYVEKIYHSRGIKVKRWELDNPWDIEHIQEQLWQLMDEYKDKAIALNATGGTKPMSIAAYEIFRAHDKPIFYIHPEKDRLIWLHPGNEPSTDLADKIRLKEFLLVHGADEISLETGVTAEIRELTQELIYNIKQYSKAITSLNYLTGITSDKQLVSPEIGKDKTGDHQFWRLIELFQQAELLRLEDNRLYFPDEPARFMVNGGWLEMYAYACCLNLKKQAGIQDVARSIEIRRQQEKGKVINEIDTAFLHNNRLYMLECKTKVYRGNHARHDEGAEVLYKLDSLRDVLGGAQARAMLVSVKKMQKHHLDRARELNIELCYHEGLKDLEEKIAQWLK